MDSAALDLVEEVQFGDWDEEELFAAEAKALAQFQNSQNNNAIEAGHDASNGGGKVQESQRHRYLTQRWMNGTMCDMNHQPRTVEVQYHCSNAEPAEDRIVMFKETTICNYVLVIETPRLCVDPAFGSEKEEAALPIQCHQVVDDDYVGPTVGDPEKVQPPVLSELDAKASADPELKGDPASQTSTTGSDAAKLGQNTASDSTPKTKEGAQDASGTSHTYGDLSRYGSVHDDFYDEATGGHGEMYDHFHHEHDHHHDHHQHDDGEVEETRVLVEIGLDEDGKLHVNKVVESADDASSAPSSAEEGTAKEGRRRESGKKRSDDESTSESDTSERPMEIQLDYDDLLAVINGGEGANLEKKLAEKISAVLSREMKQQRLEHPDIDDRDDTDDDIEEHSKDQGQGRVMTPEDIAKLYDRLMAGITATVVTMVRESRPNRNHPRPHLRTAKANREWASKDQRYEWRKWAIA